MIKSHWKNSDNFEYVRIFISSPDSTIRKNNYELLRQTKLGDPVAMSKLASFFESKGDTERAIKFYKKIIALEDKNASSAYNNIGSIYYRSNQLMLAHKNFEIAASMGLTLAKWNLGMLFLESDQRDGAVFWLEAAAREGNWNAKNELERIKRRPSKTPINTWQDAEELAKRWMQYFGFYDSKLTASGSDGGWDVDSSKAVAQVKFEGTNTGRPEIQKIAGIAHDQEKQALFFSLSGYTKAAIEWANSSRIRVALFSYDNSGNLTCVNTSASNLVKGKAGSSS